MSLAQPPGPSTRSVHLAERADPDTGSITAPIIANSAFAHPDVETWLAVASGAASGHIYTRNSNPTNERFEAKMAALEHTEAAASFATGMGAISTTLLALTGSGRRVVTTKDCYGGSYLMITQILPRFGVECVAVDTDDADALDAAIAEGCDVVYLETPTNPALKLIDLERHTLRAHEVGAVVVVDNTFATPINSNPVDWGVDLVVHSASKYLGGHSDVLGGVVCGSAAAITPLYHVREILGTTMDPQIASLFLRSLKTLGLRVTRQNASALAIAQWLSTHPAVSAVHYPGLPTHPGHDVAVRQMRGFGGMLSFELVGGMDAVSALLPRLKFAYLAANLGQVETIVGLPATTSHVELTAQERADAGIAEGLVRYSVGIEDVSDLITDLDHALENLP